MSCDNNDQLVMVFEDYDEEKSGMSQYVYIVDQMLNKTLVYKTNCYRAENTNLVDFVAVDNNDYIFLYHLYNSKELNKYGYLYQVVSNNKVLFEIEKYSENDSIGGLVENNYDELIFNNRNSLKIDGIDYTYLNSHGTLVINNPSDTITLPVLYAGGEKCQIDEEKSTIISPTSQFGSYIARYYFTNKDIEYIYIENIRINPYCNLRDKGLYDTDVKINFNGTVVPEDKIAPQILSMLNSPLKANGEPKTETWLLIKLYENTIAIGAPCIDRKDLVALAGTAMSGRAGQSSTFFNNFKAVDLAYLNQGMVYPGKNLEDWFHGKATLVIPSGRPNGGRNYAGGVDLSPFLNKSATAKVAQGAKPMRSSRVRGFMPNSKSNSTSGGNSMKTTNTAPSSEEPTYVTATLDMFESVGNQINKEAKKEVPKHVVDRVNKIRSAYRKTAELEEDCEITEDMIDDFKFRKMCADNGWNFEKTRKSLLRKDV